MKTMHVEFFWITYGVLNYITLYIYSILLYSYTSTSTVHVPRIINPYLREYYIRGIYDYVSLCCRMRDYLQEYIEQLLDANADDEETPVARQSRLAARQALADYRMVDHVLRSPLLPADIELRLSHAVSLWNLAFEFTPNKWHNG